MDVAGGHQRQLGFSCPAGQAVEPLVVVAIQKQFGQQVAAIAKTLAIAAERIEIGQLARRRHDAGQQAFAMGGYVGERNLKLAFGCPAATQSDQSRQPAVRGPIGGPQDDGAHRRA